MRRNRTGYRQNTFNAVWGVCAVSLSSESNADAIIPYLAVPWGQAFLFPLVVLLEASVLWPYLKGRFLPLLGQSLVANCASTLIGALLYVATMPLVGDTLFQWWFKGDFASEAIRNACIALAFVAILWTVSWIIESLIIGRMRKLASWKEVAKPCAIANVATYIPLLGLALWFQH